MGRWDDSRDTESQWPSKNWLGRAFKDPREATVVNRKGPGTEQRR